MSPLHHINYRSWNLPENICRKKSKKNCFEESSPEDCLALIPNVNNQISKSHKNLRISTQCLEKEINLDYKPLWGGSLLIHHMNSQLQDDSKWKGLLGTYRRLGGTITTNGPQPT